MVNGNVYFEKSRGQWVWVQAEVKRKRTLGKDEFTLLELQTMQYIAIRQGQPKDLVDIIEQSIARLQNS